MLETLDEATARSYEQAGWTRCNHQGNRYGIHINVKVHGDYIREQDMFRTLIERLDMPEDEIRRVANAVYERELEAWWEDLEDFDYGPNVEYLLSEDYIGTGLKKGDFWQDGRMGGWLHVSSRWASEDETRLLLLAEHCKESVKYFASENWRDYWGDTIEEQLVYDPEAGKERCPTCNKIR
jgi:hypothetical protein